MNRNRCSKKLEVQYELLEIKIRSQNFVDHNGLQPCILSHNTMRFCEGRFCYKIRIDFET